MAEGKAADQPRSGLDMIIAAVADVNGCVVVTDNERDLVELQAVNPCGAPPDTAADRPATII